MKQKNKKKIRLKTSKTIKIKLQTLILHILMEQFPLLINSERECLFMYNSTLLGDLTLSLLPQNQIKNINLMHMVVKSNSFLFVQKIKILKKQPRSISKKTNLLCHTGMLKKIHNLFLTKYNIFHTLFLLIVMDILSLMLK